MNLPPLPLQNGSLFIDNSLWVESIDSCWRLLQYRALFRRIPAGESMALSFGGCGHACLEHRYRKYQNAIVPDEYYQEISEIITKQYEAHPCPIEDWRTSNWLMQVLKNYNQRYELEDFELLKAKETVSDGQGKVIFKEGDVLVEMPFVIPLYVHETPGEASIPVFYIGKIDLVVKQDNMLFVMDHKFISQLGQSFFLRAKMLSQLKGYVWAFSMLTGKLVDGYIINAIRSKEPPLYIQGKSDSRSAKQDPAKWWGESFAREKFYCTPNMLDEWKNNVIDKMEMFFWNYARGRFPMATAGLSCVAWGRCPFYDVCSLDLDDRPAMLSSGMFTTNEWSPLNKE